jgi:hypothetical protein
MHHRRPSFSQASSEPVRSGRVAATLEARSRIRALLAWTRISSHKPELRWSGVMAEPVWRVIAEDLRRQTESGELRPNRAPLPTERLLQSAYGAVGESPEPQA